MNELLPARIAAQARRTPDAVAVIEGEHALTYAALASRAARLAGRLRELGAGRGSFVAVCLRRRTDLVTALLAAWQAGAAYVPIDPSYPRGRQELILAESGARVLLTETALAPGLPGGAATVIAVDDLDGSGDAAVEDVLGPDPAYVIYTSGSTGKPKGVVITHEGIANRVGWTIAQHGIGAGDRVLQKTSLGFDAAVWEFFAPLASGATVVLAPDGAQGDPAALVRAVIEHEVTILQAVPSVYALLAEEPRWPDCSSLRLLFSAGEPLHGELAARLARPLGATLWNTYGPTECAIDVTAHQWDPAADTGPVPIGRPISGLSVRVLDDRGKLVPVAVPGELFAGGPAVAQGYLDRPGLTAERFVPDPFGAPGARLYRTGDRVRWRPDGVLEYLGRLDDQVKVNGVRIEPAEVEAVLASHPAVRGAAVTARPGADGGRRLVAFVRGADGPDTTGPDVTGLRSWLAERLPHSHIPAQFVAIEDFPRTPSGKVDRRALPDVPAAAAQDAGFVAPRTPAEQLVSQAWQDVLGVDRAGATDDFFALGGSSLLLTRLAGRLRAASGGEVRLRGLFAATTVAAQAELLAGSLPGADAGSGSAGGPARPVPVPRDAPLPLSSGQRRLWFLDQLNPGSAEWVSPLFMRLPAGTTEDAARRALESVQRRHEALRTRYLAVRGEPYQVIGEPEPVELRVADATAGELADLFREQFARGFSLEHGPLWRALLARIPGQDPVLLVTTHHIASDGWSTVIYERELRDLCGGAQPLPPAALQYADYAAWQREQLTDAVVAAELEYWRGALDGMPALALPADRPRPPVRDARGAAVQIAIPRELAARVDALARRTSATPFMVWLTAFAVLLGRHSGQWDIPVGTPVTGRPLPELADIAGFFLNSLTVRCQLDGELTFTEAIGRVRQAATGAFAHQDLPFERLVDELAPGDLSRTPLYQAAFDLAEDGATSVTTADTTLMEAFRASWAVAKTDLTLFMWRQPDGGLAGAFEYATSLFDAATVARLADRFAAVVAELSARPGTRLDSAGMLAPGEEGRLASAWNDTHREWPGGSVPAMIAAAAAAAPGAEAVRCGDAALTYAGLLDRAGQLRGALALAGVVPGDVVGVVAERSVSLVAAMLAVWQSGAAYLPLDPGLPASRVTAMLEQAGARLTLAPERHRSRLPGSTLAVDVPDSGTAAPALAPAEPAPDSAAYVIFTSGSTGTPKGVVVSHRGLANHLRWAAEELMGAGPGGAPVLSSLAFDLAVPNLWAPLTCGERTWLLPPDAALDEAGGLLAGAGPFSFVKLTPSHLEVLARQLPAARLAGLAGAWVVAGEAFPRGLLERFRALAPDATVLNEYGPTEASVGTCTYPAAEMFAGEVVPIGRPLPNLAMHVLDGAMRLVPAGVAGELFVGGTGVARGYAGAPGLTAARFVPDPWGPPGARLYRTGDLARRRADGVVEFLGRVDDQVKIRGYRVEPGDVRAALLAHPEVREAFVTAWQETLIAYHVSALGQAELAAHCAARLPDYLVPRAFVALDRLPLNANGKVDRRALPDPDEAAVTAAAYVAPGNEVEEHISRIWAELLGHDPGAAASFFDSGGHSILAIRLVAQLQEDYGIRLPLRAVFENPTVAGIALEIEDRVRAEIDEMIP